MNPAPDDPSPAVPDIPAADASKQNDKGWVLQSFKASIDVNNQLEATARITNDNEDTSSAVFTITMSSGGQIIGTLHGSAQSARPGQTMTVGFYSTDPPPSGSFTYEFQTDMSYPS